MGVVLKSCVVVGDLSADSAVDQYPTEPVCADCIETEAKRREDNRIVSVGDVVNDRDAMCYFCDTGADE
jgi:hypothetical protein